MGTLGRDRFAGLNARQIWAHLTLELFSGKWLEKHGLDYVRGAHHRLEIPFTKERAILYAQMAERASSVELAEQWYGIVDTEFSDPRYLRTFYVEEGKITSMLLRFKEEVTEQEIRDMTDVNLSRYLDQQIRECREPAILGCRRIQYRKGWEQILARSLIEPCDVDLAEQAAQALGRDFTQEERLKIGRNLIQESRPLATAFQFVARHQLKELYRLFLDKAIFHATDSFTVIRHWAKQLGLELTVADLSSLLHRYLFIERDDARLVGEAIEACHPDEETMQKLRLSLRGFYLSRDNIRQAEAYGRKAGYPLTEDELRAFIDKHDREDPDLKFAMELLVRQIVEPSPTPGSFAGFYPAVAHAP